MGAMNASVGTSSSASLSAQTARAERRHAERQGPAQNTFAALMQSRETAGDEGAKKPPGAGLTRFGGEDASGAPAEAEVTSRRQQDRLQEASQEGPSDPSWWSWNLPGLNAYQTGPEASQGCASAPEDEAADEVEGESAASAEAGRGVRSRGRARPGPSPDGSGREARDTLAAGMDLQGGRPGRGASHEQGDAADRASHRDEVWASQVGDPGAGDGRPPAGEGGVSSDVSAAWAAGGAQGAEAVLVPPSPDGAGFAAQLMGARTEASARAGESAPEGPRTSAHAVLQADDPGFPGQVALKVAQWSASGIQQATLDLHPAELGPIQIRIDLDGNNASIRFGAAHEGTRSLLDEALPALAVALQADGLSLAASQITDMVKPTEDSSALADRGSESRSPSSDGSAGSSGSGSGDPRPRSAPTDAGLSTASGLAPGASAWQAGALPGADAASETPLRPSGGRLRLDLYA